MPTLALHFAIDYLGPDCKSRAKGNLRITYLITFLFIILLWITDYYAIDCFSAIFIESSRVEVLAVGET